VVVEQTYLDGYKAHAALETHTALAQVEGNKATVWVGTQTPFPARDQIAQALGFSRRQRARHHALCPAAVSAAKAPSILRA